MVRGSLTGDEFLELIEDKDSTFLGKGVFSSVYTHPTDPNLAIKVQSRTDSCFESYVAKVGAKNNPHLPKIVEQATLDDGSEIYVVEKLKPVHFDGSWYGYLQSLDFPAQVAIYTLFAWEVFKYCLLYTSPSPRDS